MQFNAGNGSLIKALKEKVVEKDGIQTYVYSHSKEITSLYFYQSEEDEDQQHLILLSTSYDSLINVGKVNGINCLDFSKRFNSYATGMTVGLVVVWDYEMARKMTFFI